MIVLLRIGIFCLNIVYSIIKILPIKNRVLMISRQSDKPSVDFILLKNELNDNKIESVFLCKTLNNGLKSKLCYIFHMFKQMYYISTSKIIILDSYCIVISLFKNKNEQSVIQMWHALGAFKKFGKSLSKEIKGKDKHTNIDSNKIDSIMKMHNNYDYIFTSSKECIKHFGEAFGYDNTFFKIFPLPRLDRINNRKYCENAKTKIFDSYPILRNNKKNIVYCPTFRDNNNDYKYIKRLIDSIDYSLYNLVIKLHPSSKYDFSDKRVILDTEFETFEFGFIADFFITDYSAVMFEIILFNKPIYFYAYDKEEYLGSRNFYLNYDMDLPGKVYTDSDSLMNDLNNNIFSKTDFNSFKNKYIALPKKSYTKDIVAFVIEKINSNVKKQI